jgi:hypothetical protein
MAHFLNLRTRQPYGILTLAVGDSEEVGLWGGGPNGEDLVIKPNDPSIATVSTKTLVFTSDRQVRRFTLRAQRTGNVMVEARLGYGGPVWAYMQLAVVSDLPPGEPLPDFGPDAYKDDPNYLDKVTAGHFDITDNKFWVDHERRISVDLDYKKIIQNLKSSSGVTIYVYYRDHRNNIIYPRVINRVTAPNIAEIVRQTDEAMSGARGIFALGVELVTNPWFNLSWLRIVPRTPPSSVQRARAAGNQQVKVPRGPRTSLLVAGDRRSLVRILIDDLKAAGKPVKVNLGGTGEQPNCINVNPLLDEQVRDVPMLIFERAENIGTIFPQGSVDRIISNNIVYGTVNWSEAAAGSFKALKPGGTISIAPFAGNLAEHAAEIESALKAAGFRNVVNQGHLIEAIKP